MNCEICNKERKGCWHCGAKSSYRCNTHSPLFERDRSLMINSSDINLCTACYNRYPHPHILLEKFLARLSTLDVRDNIKAQVTSFFQQNPERLGHKLRKKYLKEYFGWGKNLVKYCKEQGLILYDRGDTRSPTYDDSSYAFLPEADIKWKKFEDY